MEKEKFMSWIKSHESEVARIRQLASEVHAAVNQHYDRILPYSVHLDSVVECLLRYAHNVCDNEDEILPLVYGAYFHDSIEDARLTYNDVKRIARTVLSESQAHIAAEIAYALTNEKGRTRAERANDRYYEGIRATPYAPICKMADRMANVTYSVTNSGSKGANAGMRKVYAEEQPHFAASVVTPHPADPRLAVPESMTAEVNRLLGLQA